MSATLDAKPTALSKAAIRTHYDLATPFYRLLWGAHIHHGLWSGQESPEEAQLRLIRQLQIEADIQPGSVVLDVGCGMGGSSIDLAKHLQCQVTGLTLSPVQRLWAAFAAGMAGVRRQARFQCQDVEEADLPDEAFDIVWSIECTEHLFDKQRFFQKAARWLRPGGKVAICAWLAGDPPHTPEMTRQIDAVCKGFLCPSLGTAQDYEGWLTGAGLQLQVSTDWTSQVMQTWEICRDRVQKSGVGILGRFAGRDMTNFLDHFTTILEAYQTGAMKYGCFVVKGSLIPAR